MINYRAKTCRRSLYLVRKIGKTQTWELCRPYVFTFSKLPGAIKSLPLLCIIAGFMIRRSANVGVLRGAISECTTTECPVAAILDSPLVIVVMGDNREGLMGPESGSWFDATWWCVSRGEWAEVRECWEMDGHVLLGDNASLKKMRSERRRLHSLTACRMLV